MAAQAIWSNDDRKNRNTNAREQAKKDSQLLYDARNKVGKGKGKGKMSEDQYRALKRKIGGTARDYFKDWVDVDGEYTDTGYVGAGANSSSVPGLPILLAVLFAVLATAGYVVSATS